MLNQLSRPHLPILCMALGLAACAAPGGVDGDLSGVGGKSDEVGAETLKVEVAAFQNALAWHAETGGSSDDARWAALRGRAETLRGFATTGELADADALLLREELLPLTGRLERAHAITDEYELMCAAGPLDVRGALVREGASDQSLTLPADLDTVASEVRGDVMDATCDPTVLNWELVAAGVKQSLANDMRLRLTLLPAEYDWLVTDPVDYSTTATTRRSWPTPTGRSRRVA